MGKLQKQNHPHGEILLFWAPGLLLSDGFSFTGLMLAYNSSMLLFSQISCISSGQMPACTSPIWAFRR